MKDNVKPAPISRAWSDVRGLLTPGTRSQIHAAVERHATSLAEDFYRTMLTDPQASTLLDHELVNQRLHGSMVRWLCHLFDDRSELDALVAAQRKTGEVHARIGVSMALVAEGARVLKRRIVHHLASSLRPSTSMAEAVQYVYELMDLAIDAMNGAAQTNANRLTRTDEAYRLFFLTQNLKAERERQKTQLLEWAHQILVRHYWDVDLGQASSAGVRASGSQFGMWLQHKASVLFEQAPELARIQASMAHVENHLLPWLTQAREAHEDVRGVVTAIHQQIEEIKTLLDDLFDQVSEVDDGRDGVTRLLHRRYFPSVVKREIAMAQASRGSFSLLMVDIDQFRAVGQNLGLEVADLVLAQVAEALTDSVRAGDFVFRVGEDQFLVLLADADPTEATQIAEGLRRRIASLVPRTPNGAGTALTASIGVATFDGHPDYQQLLDRTEQALRNARNQGRNRVAFYTSAHAPSRD